MSTLAQLEARVQQFLMDATATIWTTAALDEAIRLALQEFSQIAPCGMETVLTLPGAGREIALDALDELLDVTEVWWPYDTLAEVWPPNRVRGYRVWWDDARPVLSLNSNDGGEPQTGDQMRVWYTRPHRIQNLDGATVSTLRPIDEALIVLGAAGHACFARSVDIAENAGTGTTATPNLAALGSRFLKEFRYLLDKLRVRGTAPAWADPFGAGWRLDSYDQ